MDCYIYYKSELDHAEQIPQCVELLRVDLMSKMLHPVRLQRRPVSDNGIITWMEIYHDVPADFEQTLNSAVTKCGIQAFIRGERRLEYFMNLQD
jgi:hypothetical protein